MAAEAMEYFGNLHTGTRKDGVTPSFDHQISIAHYVRSILPHLMYPEDTIIAVLGHDTVEDIRGITIPMLAERFGTRATDGIWKVTKKGDGFTRNEDQLFAEMSNCPIASIVKPADRLHNFSTMVGVFTPEKQLDYVQFAEDRILPMIKKARRNFPKQEPAYENLKFNLLNVINSVKIAHGK